MGDNQPAGTPFGAIIEPRWGDFVQSKLNVTVPLIASEAHLRRVLTEYVAFYNEARPHQGLEQRCPVALPAPVRAGPVRRRDRLGGLLHDDYREAA